jgi:hypothetical protein
MANRMHTPIDDAKAAAHHAVVDRTPTHPGFQQLAPRDHNMLTVCQRRDRPLHPSRPRLTPYYGSMLGELAHGARMAGESAWVLRGP